LKELVAGRGAAIAEMLQEERRRRRRPRAARRRIACRRRPRRRHALARPRHAAGPAASQRLVARGRRPPGKHFTVAGKVPWAPAARASRGDGELTLLARRDQIGQVNQENAIPPEASTAVGRRRLCVAKSAADGIVALLDTEEDGQGVSSPLSRIAGRVASGASRGRIGSKPRPNDRPYL